MSTELAIFKNGLPDYLKNIEQDETTKALMGGSGGGMKRISIKGGVWRMVVSGKELAKNEDRSLNVVVVSAADKVMRSYYESQYVEGMEHKGPVCWSINEQTPDPKSSNPQATRCIDCAKNIKGSGQGTSRACRYSQRIAVVLANEIDTGDIYQMTLPASSIFGDGEPGKWPLKAYANMLYNNKVPITAVITEMRFDTDSATPKITFKPAGVLTEAQHTRVIELAVTPAAKRAITMTVAEIDQVKAAVGLSTPTEANEPMEEEPKKKGGKKEDTVIEKKDMGAIMEAWDD